MEDILNKINMRADGPIEKKALRCIHLLKNLAKVQATHSCNSGPTVRSILANT